MVVTIIMLTARIIEMLMLMTGKDDGNNDLDGTDTLHTDDDCSLGYHPGTACVRARRSGVVVAGAAAVGVVVVVVVIGLSLKARSSIGHSSSQPEQKQP